jgi:Cys-tRNA(Pro) deacylase
MGETLTSFAAVFSLNRLEYLEEERIWYEHQESAGGMTLGLPALEQFLQAHGIQGTLIPLSVPTPTVETAAEAIGTTPDRIVKSLLFLIDERPVLVISSGTDRIERRNLAKHFHVGRTRVKLADAGTVLSITGYEVGAVPPFGHKQQLDVILERRVFQQPVVYAGGGSIESLLEIAPEEILRVTHATVLDLHDDVE